MTNSLQQLRTSQGQHKFTPDLHTLNQKTDVKLSILFNVSTNSLRISTHWIKKAMWSCRYCSITAILRETWLVCRLYTQGWRTICTSVSLWVSIRVSLLLFKFSYHEGKLVSLSPLYPRMRYDLHIGIAMGLHQGFAHSLINDAVQLQLSSGN